ncbi:penicillin-binding transpeptidase domain-containing protein [Inconstantimicrobium mannanitabidum]|uniref:Penicillin-binding protein n=1 Tax=Inconstantimicrobium mannanitabidum TaxID=1604901 RepID=A0ACB5RBU6_9CLOT|nr:penicillin-binding transpeptidase domain-containing protein [Clostridium sp. TW13]GKX66610.1 penicillin-binding protein [Clostridium sp. TW13]
MKKELLSRYIKITSIIICMFILLIIKIFIIQKDYENETMPTIYKGGNQTEKISQIDYQVYDYSGKNIVSLAKKYILVIEVNAFRMNNVKDSQEGLLAFNYIMKSQYPDFSLDDIVNKNGKLYFDKLDAESYEKLKDLTKVIKGIYVYNYDCVDNKDAWKIENILTLINKDKSKNINSTSQVNDSLEKNILNTVRGNKDNIISLSLNSKGFYSKETYGIDDNNLNPQLTLDEEWQQKIRDVLNRKLFSKLPNIGVAIVESSTGKVRVLAQKDESKPNILIGATGLGFPPGSIFKVVDEITAISENKLDLSKKYVCNGVLCKKNGKPHPHGTLNLNEALRVSCNEAFSQLGASLGYENIMSMCDKLGLFSKVLNLNDEAAGVRAEKISGMNNISIGQSLNVTPIQMTAVINTVVNNGVYIKPTILEGYKDNKNQFISLDKPKSINILDSQSALIIKNQLKDVVNNGSGVKAQVSGVEIGGKTGTAEGTSGNDIWFLGYFKMNNKYYSMVILVPNLIGTNDDGDSYGGGNTAAPIFSQVVEAIK